MATVTENKSKITHGSISQVVGVVVDIEFHKDHLPAIYNALKVTLGDHELTLEVAQHLSESSVRAVALGTTDGLQRGTEVIDTGTSISVPVGDETLGRMFNVVGKPIDGKPDNFNQRSPI